MSENSVREWLYASKSKGMSLGLSRVNAALEALGRPDKQMDCIHVAGSNGKGSACAQLVAGLVRAGYRVGLFSSPHLVRIEERVRVDGRAISDEEFDDALNQVKALNCELTFFEITYLTSLIACRDAGVSIMVLETGLGGRLDATRSAEVVACLVTSVSLEHSDILGDTIEKVAREKAAIWRPGVPMLIRDPGSAKVRNAMRDEAISARFYSPETSTFMDEAADLAELLCAMIGYSFVRRPISWPARMQYIEGEQNYLLEAAHNPSGMRRAVPEIAALLPERWSLLLGTSPQQEMDEFLAPIFTLIENKPPLEIITTEPQNGRYPGVVEPIKGIQHIENPDIAIRSFTQENDLIVVTGSLYLCGNILSYLGLNADIL
ncbi:MAG: bifunctional folylpolyglutamate synthase/dihydrofolate synthase [Candidatus Poseidoniaceae archaeon]